MLPQKATPTLPHTTVQPRPHADWSSVSKFLSTKSATFNRLWTGVLGFCAGCAAYHVAVASGVQTPALPSAGALSGILRAPQTRSNIDDDSWKCVSMYRGRPRDAKLDADAASQVGQDATILDIFAHKRAGTFLDLASNDAVSLSNTLVLEQRYNWTGVCVEPNPSYAPGYLHRSCSLVQAVVGPKEGERVNFNFRGTDFAGAFGGIEGFDNPRGQAGGKNVASHYTVSVAKILRDFGMPRTIDYMSLDIEGAEAWAFASFPWEAYTFLAITVERPKPALKDMLASNGYTYLCNHGGFGDELWVHGTLPRYEEVVHKYGGRTSCV